MLLRRRSPKVIVGRAVTVADRASAGIAVQMRRRVVRVPKAVLVAVSEPLKLATSVVRDAAMIGVAIAADLDQGGIVSAMIAVGQR